jgi:hypothetical protein
MDPFMGSGSSLIDVSLALVKTNLIQLVCLCVCDNCQHCCCCRRRYLQKKCFMSSFLFQC